MILPPVLTQKLQANMRLAFTQACVRFPNGLYLMPVHNAVAQCFAYTAKFMGSTYYLMDTRVYPEILSLVQEAETRLHGKENFQKLMAGKSSADAKRLGPLVRGLDLNSGQLLLSYANNGRDRGSLLQIRGTMVQNHRNRMANEFVDLAVDRAGMIFKDSERGESVGQSLGTERRAR